MMKEKDGKGHPQKNDEGEGWKRPSPEKKAGSPGKLGKPEN